MKDESLRLHHKGSPPSCHYPWWLVSVCFSLLYSLSLYLCVCPFIRLSLHLSSIYIYLKIVSVRPSASPFIYIYLEIVSGHLSASPSIMYLYLSWNCVYLSICLTIYHLSRNCVCLSVCLPLHLYLSWNYACLSASPSIIYLSISISKLCLSIQLPLHLSISTLKLMSVRQSVCLSIIYFFFFFGF